MDDFESCMNAIDIECDSEDVTFTFINVAIYVYKLNIPQFIVVKRSSYAKGTNCLQEVVEYHRQNCHIPTSGNCFFKCNNYFTDKHYMNEILTFIRYEEYRSGVLTSARFHPFCGKYNINLGFLDGKRKNPKNITEKKTTLFIHNNHFCSI